MASFVPGAVCQRAWQYIGQVYPGQAYRFIWGNQASTPSIQCYGLPFGTYVRWSWSFGQSSYACRMNEDPHRNFTLPGDFLNETLVNSTNNESNIVGLIKVTEEDLD